MKFLLITVAVCSIFVFFTINAMGNPARPQQKETYQGKTIRWWANHTVKARKDANARAVTIRYLKSKVAQAQKIEKGQLKVINNLKSSLKNDPSINECIQLATIAYPSFTVARANYLIDHESRTSGLQFAKNPTSTASGLYQFLTSTFASTPYGKAGMSIWSPCAQSLAAGWMHENGRGGEWSYG